MIRKRFLPIDKMNTTAEDTFIKIVCAELEKHRAACEQSKNDLEELEAFTKANRMPNLSTSVEWEKHYACWETAYRILLDGCSAMGILMGEVKMAPKPVKKGRL